MGGEEEYGNGEERRISLSLSLSLWMDHNFLCPLGVYSVDEALVTAMDARVLMDMPDADEKKCGFSRHRHRLARRDI